MPGKAKGQGERATRSEEMPHEMRRDEASWGTMESARRCSSLTCLLGQVCEADDAQPAASEENLR